jgi:hypothetical protein
MQPWDPRILEALDAYRPDSDEPPDGEMAFLKKQLETDGRLRAALARVQHLDARVAAAFHDVPIPQGMAERILANVAVEAAMTGPSLDEMPPAAPGGSRASTVATPRRRRWVVATAVSAALAASLLFLAFVWHGPSDELTVSETLQHARDHFTSHSSQGWRLVAAEPAPRQLRPSRFVIAGPSLRWRSVEFVGREGAAYQITIPGRAPAMLYVVPGSIARAAPTPPMDPVTTQGLSTGVWSERGLVYVLVVAGDRRDYRGYINLSPLATAAQPIARAFVT